MTSFGQEHTHVLKKSFSYNDLKKRRMLRSSLNKDKLAPINHDDKENITNYLPTATTANLNQNQPNYLCKIITAVKQIQSKIGQDLEKAETDRTVCQLKNELLKKSDNPKNESGLGCKRVKSMRILTRRGTGTKFNSTLNVNTKILARIDNREPNQVKQKVTDISKKYKTVPTNSSICKQKMPLNTQKDSKNDQKQNIFFNTISPIQEKLHRGSIINREEVSGFSIIFDIEEKEEKSKNKIHLATKYKDRAANAMCKQNAVGLGGIESEFKIPKIVNKKLPKDFFIRV